MSDANDLPRRILLACGNGDTRLFRNNTGLGWVGQVTRLQAGQVLIHNARPLHAGLCEGSADLIGWRAVEITPAMVGQRLAIFVAIEAKTGTGRLTEAQRAFLDAVRGAGGVAGVARSAEDAVKIIRGGR